ncbi:hypothetical protein LUZ60_010708 [Juncus effusus]|nr:hypothetical protein LUZ60_010708 [Juncus effusus]
MFTMEIRASKLLSCLIFVMAIQVMFPVSNASDLKIGYYKDTCPEAESIVKSVVSSFVNPYPGLGAGLIRMFFHDCFIRGCDASVLLDPSPSNPDPEKNAIPNNPSLRGFEVIDAAKDALENACPGVVSCADIIAFAARDSTYILGKFSYDIPSGRYDGTVSIKDDANKLPAPFFNLTQLKASFASVGLSTDDLVALLGAHSIGRSHCSSFKSRLYPTIDPTMDLGFGLFLRTQCPEDATMNVVVPQDFVTPNDLDKQYYDNVKTRKSLFFSDWSLLTSPETHSLVERYSMVPGLFEADFGQSMVNLGYIGVLSKFEGQIRKSCRSLN